MNGAGFGAFTQGLAGGISAGKSIKDMKKAEDIAAKQEGTDFGVGLPVMGADVASAKSEEQGSDVWGTLSGILDGLPGIAGVVGGSADNSVAGKLLGGGNPLGKTIIGKLTGMGS